MVKCLFWVLLLTPQNSKGSKIIASTKKKMALNVLLSFLNNSEISVDMK